MRQLLRHAARDVVPLNRTGAGETAGLLLTLARFGGAPCVVLGQDRSQQGAGSPLGPAGLREARRGMKLADEPSCRCSPSSTPLVRRCRRRPRRVGWPARSPARWPTWCCSTPRPSACCSARAPAGEPWRCCPPTGWCAPSTRGCRRSPPEGASAIIHRTTDRAAEMATVQGVRSLDLLRAGIVDRVVAEHPDAADEPGPYLDRLARVLEAELTGLLRRDPRTRLAARLARYRRLGSRAVVPRSNPPAVDARQRAATADRPRCRLRALIALGGNAMTGPGGDAAPAEQDRAVTVAMERVADLVGDGVDVLLTHGNGPQVGNLLVKNELAAHVVPPVPLDWCGAQTQGTIGFLVLDALESALAASGARDAGRHRRDPDPRRRQDPGSAGRPSRSAATCPSRRPGR